jgi:hypothetical protein
MEPDLRFHEPTVVLLSVLAWHPSSINAAFTDKVKDMGDAMCLFDPEATKYVPNTSCNDQGQHLDHLLTSTTVLILDSQALGRRSRAGHRRYHGAFEEPLLRKVNIAQNIHVRLSSAHRGRGYPGLSSDPTVI